MKNYLVCFLLFTSSIISAQPVYQKTYGGPLQDYGYGIVSTMDGGFAVIGHSNSFNPSNFDALLIKLDANANVQWSRLYGGAGVEEAMKLVQTSDGGYAICGNTTSYGSGGKDALLIKADAGGNLEWIKTYGGLTNDGFLSIHETKDHGFILGGSTTSFGQGGADMLFVKTDSVGDTLWTKIIGGIDSDQGTDAEETIDGGYIFSGREISWGSGINDIFIMKTDDHGDSLWTKILGGTAWDEGMKVKQTTDGGYIVTGASTGFTNTSYDAYLNKIDSLGNLTWTKLYAGDHNDATYDVLQLHDGGYIITGETESFGSNHLDIHPGTAHDAAENGIHPVNNILGTDHSNVIVIRTDANGDTVWSRAYGGNKMDEAYSLVQTADSGFAILAFSIGLSNDSIDYYLIKTNKNGYSSCNEAPAPVVVITPPTVMLTVNPQVISGIIVTTAVNISSVVTAGQHDICFENTGINESDLPNEEMVMYPNPASAILYLSSFSKNGSVEIFNILGEKMNRYFVQHTGSLKEINISKFPQGVYTCRITEGEKITVKIFVKE